MVNHWQRDGCMRAARTHHADFPVAAWLVLRVGGGLVRGLSAHRVLEGVATERHTLARIVVLVAALLVHEQLVALTREVAGGLGRMRFCVCGCFRCCCHITRVSFSRFLSVCFCCGFLFCFLRSLLINR